MIENTELRLGNYVLWNRKHQGLPSQPVEIYNITRSGVRFYTGIEELPEISEGYDSIEPIVLSEELALKLGFKMIHPNVYTKQVGDMLLNIGINGIIEVVEYVWKGQGIKLPFDYNAVHEIQNLWHSLSGEELTMAIDVEEYYKDTEPDELPF